MIPAEATVSRTSPRTAARIAAVQALYQAEMSGATSGETARLIEEFIRHRLNSGEDAGEDAGEFGAADTALFSALVSGALGDQEALDAMIAGTLTPGWTVERLETTLHAILRLGAHELVASAEVPVAVIVTEYVQIARAFHDGKVAGLVNGVLDGIAKLVRPDPEAGVADPEAGGAATAEVKAETEAGA